MADNQSFLKNTVPQLLKKLKPDAEPTFGIMTPQHMVEHLIWITKSSVKDYGPAPEQLSEKQLKFMRFIDKGAHFKHFPSDKQRSDLDPPRMPDLNAAISELGVAIDRLYNAESSREFYNPLMGKLSFHQLELFHAQHYKYHLIEQFGLEL